MLTEMADVIQIGRGPVGLTMAAAMAKSGHSVAVVERHRDMYGLPRAGHVDHEIVRVLAALDAAGPMLEDSYPTTEYRWVNADGELLLEFDWGARGVSGYNSDYMQYQPLIERALGDRLVESGRVLDYVGWELLSFEDRGDHVVARVARTEAAPGEVRPAVTGEVRELRGRYLVASDGANSGVRHALGIEREDLGFNEQWLVVDARKKREVELSFDCGQICDPRRPVTILPLGRRHRRWEWALLPGETRDAMERPETAWRLLAEQGVIPDDVEIIRQLVYTFEARHALDFSRGRVFLLGDAAHTMPPFMGQGMCSGLRDAVNLAWKLDLALRGLAGGGLLETYGPERSPHAKDWALISLEAGKVPCTLDPELARERDAKFRSGWRPPMPDFPKLRHGVLHLDASGRPVGAAGELGLQASVSFDGVEDRLDRFVSPFAFVVVSDKGPPADWLGRGQRDALERLGARLLWIGPAGSGAEFVDVDGSYAGYLAERGAEAVIFRPDFYVFGTAGLDGLSGLVDELLAKLHLIDRSSVAA